MRKVTRKSLDELAKEMPVLDEIQQKVFIGCGDGTQYNPYTTDEYYQMYASGIWFGLTNKNL